MNLWHAQPTRLAWWDRGATPIAQSYAASGVAPHPATTRWTYTVPTGQKTIIGSVFAQVVRDAAPTTAGAVSSRIIAAPAVGSGRFADVVEITSTVGVPRTVAIGQASILLAGQTVTATTSDPSTGGTYILYAEMNAVEFNA